MAQITAQLVKELREKSGAGMMDCKKALGVVDGDIEAAIDWLRTKGLAAAAKKAGRVAAEGLVALAIGEKSAAVVEVNSETDFVARNEQFQAFARAVADLVLANGDDLEALVALPYPGSDRTVAEQLSHNVATIGENMGLRRAKRVAVENGVVASYVHTAVAENVGKIGVLVALESTGDAEKLVVLGKQIAMHIAAARPLALNVAELDAAEVERERAVFTEQASASGKPANIIEKMVEGRLRKFYEEVVLLEQTYVMDGETKIKDVVAKASKDLGVPVSLAAFVRFQLGEGIEKKEEDFAAEVAATLKG
jgi:elongation factor Ts